MKYGNLRPTTFMIFSLALAIQLSAKADWQALRINCSGKTLIQGTAFTVHLSQDENSVPGMALQFTNANNESLDLIGTLNDQAHSDLVFSMEPDDLPANSRNTNSIIVTNQHALNSPKMMSATLVLSLNSVQRLRAIGILSAANNKINVTCSSEQVRVDLDGRQLNKRLEIFSREMKDRDLEYKRLRL